QFMARFEQPAQPEPPLPGPEAAGECPKRGDRTGRDIGLLVSPQRPAKGQEVRIIAATLDGEEPLAMRVELDGKPIEVELSMRTGVPASTVARFTPSDDGRVEVIVGRDGKGLDCTSFGLRRSRFEDESPVDLSKVWEVERPWTAAEEALYSAWIRELFAGPPEQDLAWRALSEVTADSRRNLLHDHLGRGEDDAKDGLELVPDCADTPYFLRAYWSFKRGLPYGFRKCSRGKKRAPNCFDLRTNLDAPDRRPNWIEATPEGQAPTSVPPPGGTPSEVPADAVVPTHNEKIEYFFRRSVGWSVHTGNGRTAYGDSNSDLYPVALDRRALRPGMVYADPYGH
ncbi:MAG: hypothetical protein KC431_02555, partial [Myxococcales bacterium]|nr:hypothetical protein [Myxococcales bacterium]